MDIALDAKVHFSEGGTGKITKVVVNPITGEMTHIVIRAKGSFEVEYLVPVDKIAESTWSTWSRLTRSPRARPRM
jgi:hypothetical protein